MTITMISACIFAPNIEGDGYTACADDGDCPAGRTCLSSYCAPPPWNDTSFAERRLIVVDNPAPVALRAGSAVPVRIGGDGAALPLTDIKADFRITQYDGAFVVTPTFIDRFAERFVLWVPLMADVPVGASAALGYIEQGTAAGSNTLVEEPARVFTLFDDIDRQFDAARVFVQGGVVVDAASSTANVPDGAKLIWTQGLNPPFDLTFRARIEGATCTNVYLGVTASNNVTFATPSVGFFVQQNLATVADVWTLTDSQRPLPAAAPTPIDNTLSRFRIVVDARGFRLSVNDVVVDEQRDLRPELDASVPLFATIDVDGACSITLDALWVTPLPPESPIVRVEPLVSL
jgi:hypothetical protein